MVVIEKVVYLGDGLLVGNPVEEIQMVKVIRMPKVSTNLVHAQVLSPYTEVLAGGGAPAEKVLENCGIPPEATADPNAVITMLQAYQFVDASARFTGVEGLGSDAGRSVQLTDLGPMGRSLQTAPCLLEASRSFQKAMHASEPGSKCWVEVRGGEAWLCYRPMHRSATGAVQAEQFDLQCLLTIVRIAAGDRWMPRRIRACAAPEGVLRKVREFASSQIDQSKRTTAIAFPRVFFARVLENVRDDRADGSDVGDQVELSYAVEKLLESLSAHETIPVLDAVAGRFGVCGRTLQRALEAEGASYRDLADRTIFRRAATLLKENQLPLKAVSADLGYSSSSSFIRAFRRHSGVTPNAFRKMAGSTA